MAATSAYGVLASLLLLSWSLPETRCSDVEEEAFSMRGDGEIDNPLELGDIMPQNPKLYDKMRPPKYKGNATQVLFHVTVMSLDTIDESSMTYTCDVFFAQSWKDNRLRLPDNMTSQYRLLPIEWLTEIWRPDSFFKNAKSVTFQTMTIPNHYIWLWQDKTLLYMVKLTLVLSCPMHFKNYPHDTQSCNLEIESISHTTDDLIFTWDPDMPLDVDHGIELPQLELIETKNDDCTTEYSTGKFTCLEIVFMFKRRLGYYLFHTYVPTCLIVIMSWISFWIKPEAVPARVTLGVTSLLTLSTQHANSQKSLPPVSYIKAIDVFMSGCTVFVFLSLMEYALVNIVMGDIADIEKKKSMGISNLILGTRGIPIKRNEKDGALDNEEMLQYSNHDGRDRSYLNLFGGGSMGLNTQSMGGGGIPLMQGAAAASFINTGNSTQPPPQQQQPQSQQPQQQQQQQHAHPQTQFNQQHHHGQPQQSTQQAKHNVGVQSAPGCIHTRQKQLQFERSLSTTNASATMNTTKGTPSSGSNTSTTVTAPSAPPAMAGPADSGPKHYGPSTGSEEHLPFLGDDAPYPAAGSGGSGGSGGGPPPPPSCLLPGGLAPSGPSGPSGPTATSNVISQQGIKNLVHDVQMKRQKEIRDMMKKKREKAVLVDRISRWLFPTSFILLNIVYWALFGDHDLW